MYITQGLKRAMQINGQGTATIDGERRQSWSVFGGRVARLAGALIALGLKPGDRVAILALNSDRYLETYFAVPWAGGILMPLNTRLALPELVFMLKDATPAILVVDEALQEVVPPLLAQTPALKAIIFCADAPGPESYVPYEQALAAAAPVADAERGGEEVAGIFYTGGTTGRPKGVMLTHNNIICNALSSLALLYEGEPWIYLHTAPMFHIADEQWNSGVTLLGGTHVFAPRFNPEDILTAISTYRITHCALVPTMINMLCQVPGVEHFDTSSLRKINFGGSPMPPAVITRARAVFPGCQFIQGYGQTETSPNISMLLDKYNVLEGENAGKIESAGQPVFSMEVKIVDPDDRELARGQIGEIITRGPHVMAGYWQQPEATARALRGGWMHTGDAGFMDEDGFVFIVDRVKDMIITGGENVYSAEVENALYQHPAVGMCAVIGIPHEKWGEAVHAVVVLKEEVLADETTLAAELIAHCRCLIAGYKCPASVEFRPRLPLSGAGKILKRKLRDPYWSAKKRRVN